MTDERKQTALELLKEGLDDGSYAGIMDGINIDVNQPFYQAIAKFAEDYAALKVAEAISKIHEANKSEEEYVDKSISIDEYMNMNPKIDPHEQDDDDDYHPTNKEKFDGNYLPDLNF